MRNKSKTIFLSGGGTIGPVAPLLGVYQAMRARDPSLAFVWVGTRQGPERALVEDAGIEFAPIFSGKLRRYFSLQNLWDIFRIKLAFFQALGLIAKYRPALVVSAGAYVSVPLVWAAWIRRVPVLIHQQDVRPGLANRLMAFAAAKITVTFERSLADYGPKAVWTGNSVRREFIDVKISRREARQKLNLRQSPAVVLVLGGGTGALSLNRLLADSLPALTRFCQILHIAGKGKLSASLKARADTDPNYRVFEFIDTFGMIKSFAAADLIVSRCGMSTLTEISHLAKPAILIPMPDSHQEDNARAFAEAGAAVVLGQSKLTPKSLADNIRRLAADGDLRLSLGSRARKMIKTDPRFGVAAVALSLLDGQKTRKR